MPKGTRSGSAAKKIEGRARDFYVSVGPTDYINKHKKYSDDEAVARIRVGDYGMKKLQGKKKYSESTGDYSTYAQSGDKDRASSKRKK